jgi:hypothetical protein
MNDLVESPFAGKALAETAGARQDQSRELAEMQVTYLMAQQFPRDPVKAMDRILNAFQRLTLAEKAQYVYARGGTEIRGPSIKAMEAIAAEWENIDAAWRIRSRGVDARGIPYSEIEAVAVDLQTRTRKRIGFIVPHWRDTKQGGYMLKDDRDIYELCANQAQRRVRACLEAIIPGDVVEAAMTQVYTAMKKVDTSPEARDKMLVAFEPFGVTRAMIEKRIQRGLDAILPSQFVSLKRIYASLRDEMSGASEWFEMGAAAGEAAGDGAPPPDAGGSRTANVKSRMKANAKKKDAPPPAADPETEERVVTYAEVAQALNEATNPDDANTAADLIKHVKDEAQRGELEALYRSRMADLDEGDAS